jgi:hypothetical protein
MKHLLLAVAYILLTVGVAGAALISSPGEIDSPKTVIDFEGVPLGTYGTEATPIQQGGATIYDNNSGAKVTTFLTPNDSFVSGQYFGFSPSDFIIKFSQPVSQFGLGIFGSSYHHNQLIAYDAAGNTLESSDLDGDHDTSSIFAGFKRTQADIAKIILINDWGYIGGGNPDSIGIDNITFFRPTTVPLPPSVFLLGSGLLGLLGWRRFRKN